MTLRSAAQAVVDAFPPSPGTPRGDALEALREALREEAGVSEREWLPSVEALTDAVLDAIYGALGRWDRDERSAANARIARSLHRGEGPQRVTRTADGSRIRAPRRSALARYLTNEALNAIREWERPAEPEDKP